MNLDTIKDKLRGLFKSPTDDMYSVEDEQKRRSRKGKIAFLGFLFALPVIPALFGGFSSAFDAIRENSRFEDTTVEKEKTSAVGTDINEQSLWRTIQERRVSDLQSSIKETSVAIKKSTEDTTLVLKEALEKINTNIEDANTANTKLITENNTNTEKKLDTIKNELISYVDSKAAIAKKNSFSGKTITLPDAPYFEGASTEKTKIVTNNNAQKENKRVVFKSTEERETEAREVEYYIGASNSSESTISTLSNFETAKEDAPIDFTIPMGAAKGVTMTGGNLKTLASGVSEPKVVFIKIVDDFISTNNTKLIMKGCVLEGGAIGDFGTGSAEVRIKSIQCTAITEDGEEYIAINDTVKAWVFDESNIYGIESRVVTKEGEIFAKSIPLAILNTAMDVAVAQASSNTYTTTAGTATSMQVPLMTSAADEGQNLVGRITDLWLKYLDTLTPIVQFRAGRKVTVAFSGVVKMKWEKVNFFDSTDPLRFNKTGDEKNVL